MLENNQNKNLVLIEDLGMLYPTESSKKTVRFGLYKCYCGNEFKARISAVKRNDTKSCGCLHKEKTVLHGMTKHRLYDTWKKMIDRCTKKISKDYKGYGGRGITVCIEWLDIRVFIKDMYPSYKEGLTIDRINNDLGYSKSNCRWVNQNIQSRNTRRVRTNNTSGFKGVSFNKKSQKFRTQIAVNSKKIFLGYFKDPIEAAKAYDKYVIDNSLEHTRNFN